MRCPKCGHEFKDEGRARGGRVSRRTITPEQQRKMQAARKRHKVDRHNAPHEPRRDSGVALDGVVGGLGGKE
jgi:hypothetical protein